MRTSYSIKNSTTSILSNIVILFIGFIAKTIFIEIFGVEYLGLNGLFENILMVLNFFELGIGNAIVFNLYKPISENNQIKIKSLILFYKKIYNLIIVLIFIMGIMFIPFLKYIVKTVTININVYAIYLLFLISTLISYFIAYKRSLIIAYQKSYVINIIHMLYFIIVNVCQLLIILITKNYYLYLIVKLICLFCENVVISIKANKDYPYINDTNTNDLDKETKNDILSRVKALIYHKFATVIIFGTDNIIISLFLGIIPVGLYTNYNYIIKNVSNLFGELFLSCTASIGNLLTEKNFNKRFLVFKRIRFLNFWITVLTANCLFIMIQPFIKLWLGDEYLLSLPVLVVLIINYYQSMMRNSFSIFKDSAGIWIEDKFVPLIESLLNVIFSIMLLKIFGLIGVFIGTLMSSLILWAYSYPKCVYQKLFKRNYINYTKEIIEHILIFICITIITYAISNFFIFDSLLIKFIINTLISITIPTVLQLIIFNKNEDFKYFISLIKSLIHKK